VKPDTMETDELGSLLSVDEDHFQEGQSVLASYPQSVVLRAADGDAVDDLLVAPSFLLTAAVDESSFQSWVEDDRNVPPDNQVQYVVMMMTTIDETFSIEVPPWSEQRGKKGLKPNLALYRRELRCRDQRATGTASSDLSNYLIRGYCLHHQ
jgi:hypothetical protein